MEYYIAPVDEETDFLKVSSPEELKIIDPACGSGHMLTYAFDLLYAIYEEEGYAPSDIPGLILANNLYGTEIDPRAGALAAFALTMKARARQRTFFNKQVEPNICVLEPISFTPGELDILVTRGGDRADEEAFWNQFQNADTFGSLIRPREELIAPLKAHLDALPWKNDDLLRDYVMSRAHRVATQAMYLSSRYHLVVANPPYMGSGNMDSRLARYAKNEFPTTKSDLFAMFIERSFEMVLVHGYSAMVTMESWMFLRSYRQLRETIVTRKSIKSMVHMPYLGKGSTSMGINFGTAATVILNGVNGESNATFQCVRYYETDSQGVPLSFPVQNGRHTSLASSKFSSIPGSPIAYWLSPTTRRAFERATFLGEIASIREGINTGNNVLFLRRWWEVSRGSISFDRTKNAEHSERWVPHKKGGAFRRWAGNEEYVLDWGSEGAGIHAYHGVPLSTNGAPMRGKTHFFQPSLSWSRISSSDFSIRAYPAGFSYDSTAPSIFGAEEH